jgi:hypothetical protein
MFRGQSILAIIPSQSLLAIMLVIILTIPMTTIRADQTTTPTSDTNNPPLIVHTIKLLSPTPIATDMDLLMAMLHPQLSNQTMVLMGFMDLLTKCQKYNPQATIIPTMVLTMLVPH